MPNQPPPVALVAIEAPKRVKPSNYPEPFASQMQGREKRPLGDLFGLTNFGVNLTQLAPGAVSSLRHAHTTPHKTNLSISWKATRLCIPMRAAPAYRRACVQDSRRAQATDTGCSTKHQKWSSIWRWGIEALGIKAFTLTTTSKP